MAAEMREKEAGPECFFGRDERSNRLCTRKGVRGTIRRDLTRMINARPILAPCPCAFTGTRRWNLERTQPRRANVSWECVCSGGRRCRCLEKKKSVENGHAPSALRAVFCVESAAGRLVKVPSAMSSRSPTVSSSAGHDCHQGIIARSPSATGESHFPPVRACLHSLCHTCAFTLSLMIRTLCCICTTPPGCVGRDYSAHCLYRQSHRPSVHTRSAPLCASFVYMSLHLLRHCLAIGHHRCIALS